MKAQRAKLFSDEVSELLRRVGNGEIVPRCIGPTWREMYAGDVVFMVNGWRITIFNDCDSFDYTDSVIAPDGRKGGFSDWWPTGELSFAPEQLLYAKDKECAKRMEQAFKRAT